MKAEITENGEDDLYNNIEFPLAQVLADMTRTGILVDREGIEASACSCGRSWTRC